MSRGSRTHSGPNTIDTPRLFHAYTHPRRPLPGAQSCTRFAHRVLKDKGTSLILSFCCLVMVLILLFIGLFSQLKKMLKLHSLPKNFLDSLANIATNIIHCGSVMTIQKRSKNFFEANQSINNYSWQTYWGHDAQVAIIRQQRDYIFPGERHSNEGARLLNVHKRHNSAKEPGKYFLK